MAEDAAPVPPNAPPPQRELDSDTKIAIQRYVRDIFFVPTVLFAILSAFAGYAFSQLLEAQKQAALVTAKEQAIQDSQVYLGTFLEEYREKSAELSETARLIERDNATVQDNLAQVTQLSAQMGRLAQLSEAAKDVTALRDEIRADVLDAVLTDSYRIILAGSVRATIPANQAYGTAHLSFGAAFQEPPVVVAVAAKRYSNWNVLVAVDKVQEATAELEVYDLGGAVGEERGLSVNYVALAPSRPGNAGAALTERELRPR
jgi:hypothetical protein